MIARVWHDNVKYFIKIFNQSLSISCRLRWLRTDNCCNPWLMTLNCCSITTSSMELDPLCDLTRFRLQASTSDIFEECPQVSLITLFTVCTSPYVAALLSLSTFVLNLGVSHSTSAGFVLRHKCLFGKAMAKKTTNVMANKTKGHRLHFYYWITTFGMKVLVTLLFGHPFRSMAAHLRDETKL